VGSGARVPRRFAKSISVRRGWLGDAELFREIGNASVTVLPYSQATQSGLIPLSLALGRPVVTSAVGGLPEQVRHVGDGIVVLGNLPEEFAEAVAECFDIASSGSLERRERQLVANEVAVQGLLSLTNSPPS